MGITSVAHESLRVIVTDRCGECIEVCPAGAIEESS